MVSFYLTFKYNLKCIVVDPRGVTLPKKYKKILDKNGLFIKEFKQEFNENNLLSEDIMNCCVLIIGMHPDEATVSIAKASITIKKDFAIVPCCVFPKLFNDRYLKSGEKVVDYCQLVKYIEELCIPIPVNTFYLKITGRNRILYTKQQQN